MASRKLVTVLVLAICCLAGSQTASGKEESPERIERAAGSSNDAVKMVLNLMTSMYKSGATSAQELGEALLKFIYLLKGATLEHKMEPDTEEKPAATSGPELEGVTETSETGGVDETTALTVNETETDNNNNTTDSEEMIMLMASPMVMMSSESIETASSTPVALMETSSMSMTMEISPTSTVTAMMATMTVDEPMGVEGAAMAQTENNTTMVGSSTKGENNTAMVGSSTRGENNMAMVGSSTTGENNTVTVGSSTRGDSTTELGQLAETTTAGFRREPLQDPPTTTSAPAQSVPGPQTGTGTQTSGVSGVQTSVPAGGQAPVSTGTQTVAQTSGTQTGSQNSNTTGDVPAVGENGEWGSWSTCSASCGGCGLRKRIRDCSVTGCRTTDQTQKCGLNPCPSKTVVTNHYCYKPVLCPGKQPVGGGYPPQQYPGGTGYPGQVISPGYLGLTRSPYPAAPYGASPIPQGYLKQQNERGYPGGSPVGSYTYPNPQTYPAARKRRSVYDYTPQKQKAPSQQVGTYNINIQTGSAYKPTNRLAPQGQGLQSPYTDVHRGAQYPSPNGNVYPTRSPPPKQTGNIYPQPPTPPKYTYSQQPTPPKQSYPELPTPPKYTDPKPSQQPYSQPLSPPKQAYPQQPRAHERSYPKFPTPPKYTDPQPYQQSYQQPLTPPNQAYLQPPTAPKHSYPQPPTPPKQTYPQPPTPPKQSYPQPPTPPKQSYPQPPTPPKHSYPQPPTPPKQSYPQPPIPPKQSYPQPPTPPKHSYPEFSTPPKHNYPQPPKPDGQFYPAPPKQAGVSYPMKSGASYPELTGSPPYSSLSGGPQDPIYQVGNGKCVAYTMCSTNYESGPYCCPGYTIRGNWCMTEQYYQWYRQYYGLYGR